MNSRFTNDSGVVRGSGSVSDPYIIANWEINASTAMNGGPPAGIYIQHTDAHFIIRNCDVHDGRFGHAGTLSFDGIFLNSCVNGALENNTCTRNHDGVGLASSVGITMSGNNCSSNNDTGIDLGGSSNSTLTSNTCSSNRYYGIYLSYPGYGVPSNHNTLVSNICSQNQRGIVIHTSSNNITLSSNKCTSNYQMGVDLEGSSGSILSDNNCSMNIHGQGIYLEASSCIRLINNTCSSNWDGILLSSSSNNRLVINTCSNNHNGIVLGEGPFEGSSSNEVTRNLIRNNLGYGTYIMHDPGFPLPGSSRNRIWNNTFIGNNGAGATYHASHVQAYDDGTNNSWNDTDGYGNWWSDWGSSARSYAIAGGAGARDNHPLVTTQTPIRKLSTIPIVEIVLIAVIIGALLIVIELARKTKRTKAK